MSYWRTSVLAVVVAGVLLVAGGAQAAPPALDLTVAATGLSGPVHIASTPADATAIYVVEQGGRIRRVVSGVTDPEPFLDISSKISFGGERGLLSMAFPPGYARGGSYFVYYTAKNGALKVDMVTPRPGKSPKLKSLLNVAHPKYSNHNGGQLQFTPDGTLYAGTGDGGSGGDPKNNAQNPKKLLGKLLRAFGPSTTSGRSSATACATPGASRSTARRVTCSSATSARERRRRSTAVSPPIWATRRTTAGAATRGSRTTTPRPF